MRFGQIVGSSSRLHGKLIFLEKCGFTTTPVVHASTPPRASLGLPFRALGRGSYSCLSSWRILGSNSPLSVPDLVLLAVPTGFQGASWRQIPPWQCPIGRSWLCRLASKAHLGLKRPLCGHTLASKRRRLRHLRPTCQQRRQRYRAICVRAAFLSAAVVRSTMNPPRCPQPCGVLNLTVLAD